MPIAYLASGPKGPRFESVTLRLVAQRILDHHGQGQLKVVLQVPGIPEPPIAEEFMTPLALVQWMSQSRRDGWSFDVSR